MGDVYDAIVVGARCAGSPTAMLLARRGYRVLLVDRATFPSDAISTHLIHPLGVARLARWGLLDSLVATGCPPITTYAYDAAYNLMSETTTDTTDQVEPGSIRWAGGEILAVTGKHERVVLLRLADRIVRKGGFADTGLTADQRQPPTAIHGAGNLLVQEHPLAHAPNDHGLNWRSPGCPHRVAAFAP